MELTNKQITVIFKALCDENRVQLAGTFLAVLQKPEYLHPVLIAQSLENYGDLLVCQFHLLTSY